MRCGVVADAYRTVSAMTPTLIAAAYDIPGTPPPHWRELPLTSAALLIEFRGEDRDDLGPKERAGAQILDGRPHQLTGRPYESFVPALERASRP